MKLTRNQEIALRLLREVEAEQREKIEMYGIYHRDCSDFAHRAKKNPETYILPGTLYSALVSLRKKGLVVSYHPATVSSKTSGHGSPEWFTIEGFHEFLLHELQLIYKDHNENSAEIEEWLVPSKWNNYCMTTDAVLADAIADVVPKFWAWTAKDYREREMHIYRVGQRVKTDFADYVIVREILREDNDHPMNIYIAHQLGSCVNDLLVCNGGPFLKDEPNHVFAYGDGRCNKELVADVRKHIDDETLRARVAETDSELSGFIASCCKMADCH